MDLRFLSGVLGNITALLLYLAPTPTFARIIRKRSTEQFSVVPYVMTLLNCLVLAWYGLPFVSPNNLLLTTICGTGSIIESIFVLIFLTLAPKKEKLRTMGLVALTLVVFSTIVLVSLFALHRNSRKLFCGVAVALFSSIMYASPLSVMRMVMKTKSVEYMPFWLSLFAFLCGASWVAYGILSCDPFIIVPNGIGTVLGTAQLILYTMYHKNQSDLLVGNGSKDDIESPTKEDSGFASVPQTLDT